MKSKLILHTSEFKHLEDKSSYNNNYYMMNGRTGGQIILEKCDDDNTFFYYLVDNDNPIFIGCSNNGLGGSENVEIDFMVWHT